MSEKIMKNGTGKIITGTIIIFVAIILYFVVPAMQKVECEIKVQARAAPEELAELMKIAIFSTVGGRLLGIVGITLVFLGINNKKRHNNEVHNTK